MARKLVKICPVCETKHGPEQFGGRCGCGEPLGDVNSEYVEETPTAGVTREARPLSSPSRRAGHVRLILDSPGPSSVTLQLRHGNTTGREDPEDQLSSDCPISQDVSGVNTVHRVHCRFEFLDGAWYCTPVLQDRYGAGRYTNPTYLNRRLLRPDEPALLADGDSLALDRVTFRVQLVQP